MLSLADLFYRRTVVAGLDRERFAHCVTLYPQSLSPSQSIFTESASSRTWQNTLCHESRPGGGPHGTVSSSHSSLQDRPRERLMLNTHLITILPEEWSRQGGGKKKCGRRRVITSTLKKNKKNTKPAGDQSVRQLTMRLCKLVNEFLRTFFFVWASEDRPLWRAAEEGVFYTAIKSPSVALMGALW